MALLVTMELPSIPLDHNNLVHSSLSKPPSLILTLALPPDLVLRDLLAFLKGCLVHLLGFRDSHSNLMSLHQVIKLQSTVRLFLLAPLQAAVLPLTLTLSFLTQELLTMSLMTQLS